MTLAAGQSGTTSSGVTLDAGYGAILHVKLTNGATGPTVAAQVQVQVSADAIEWYDMGGPLVGGTTANGVYDWGGVPVHIGIEWLRVAASHNTAQAVTADADISEVTAV